MVTRRSVQKEAHWREVIARQVASGVSVRRFCADEGIAEASFYAWRRELALRDREPPAASQVLEARSRQTGTRGTRSLATPPHPGGEFIPLRLIEDPGTLEVVHPGGCRVRIGGPVDAATLRQVLEIFDERGTR
jgi:Transposase